VTQHLANQHNALTVTYMFSFSTVLLRHLVYSEEEVHQRL